MEYQALDEHTLIPYLQRQSGIAGRFSDFSKLSVTEIGDGNLNLVFIIQNTENPDESVIVKQALPYLRVAGESWALTRERMRFESQALELYNRLVPGLVPALYMYDDVMSLSVMEYLGNHEIMRAPLVARKHFPKFPDHITTFLSETLFRTSDLFLTGVEKKTLLSRYINPHLNKLQEDFVYTHPYMKSEENQWNPLLDDEVKAVRSNSALKIEIAELKASYMIQPQALIHADLHTGSIMLNENDTRVIDPEFCYFGPMGYDIGAVLENLVLNYLSHFAHTPDVETRKRYQEYLLEMIRDIWTGFEKKFDTLWRENNTGELVPSAYWQYPGGDEGFKEFRARYLLNILRDMVGHGGVKFLRRMMGIVSVWDISSIKDPEKRAIIERAAIRIGIRWIMERKTIDSIDTIINIIREEADIISDS